MWKPAVIKIKWLKNQDNYKFNFTCINIKPVDTKRVVDMLKLQILRGFIPYIKLDPAIKIIMLTKA